MSRTTNRRLFVVDTNVLMHDPTALFRFHEHDLYIPMIVLEELDQAKKGVSEVARNVRQVSRFIDALIAGKNHADIARGLPLRAALADPSDGDAASGRLLFETSTRATPRFGGDNGILGTALALQHEHGDAQVTLVSKDINLRIKAAVAGIHAEDYFNDQVLEDVDLLFSGVSELPADFWQAHAQHVQSWQDAGHTHYRLASRLAAGWYPKQCLFMRGEHALEALVQRVAGEEATLACCSDYASSQLTVWGVHALNREQNFALNMLMDPDIDFVTLVGVAGSGKTLLALAAGLAQTLETRRYREIIMTRVTVPVGDDIGFLPGTEEEKMTPWMGALMDNLEVLNHSEGAAGEWGRAATNDVLRSRVKLRSLNFMRGRTFVDRYIILDEAQNLTAKQMKTLITRAGPGSKIVCLGNIAQIDTPYLTETTSGLTYVVDHFKAWPHSAHITLTRGERSRLADFASDVL